MDEARNLVPVDASAALTEILGLSVQVSAATPGVVPVGFVAVVEAVDGAGVRHVVTVISDGATTERVRLWLSEVAP